MPGVAVLVRHGQTAWSLSGQHTSTTDIPLTEQGAADATALAATLARWEFARVLSSPRLRALDTARLAGFGDRVEIVEDLAEWQYGEYEGRTTPEIREERAGWSLWTDGVPGGETAADVARRADRVIEEVRAADGAVALFAHGHILRVLGARWIGQTPEVGAHLVLPPASVSVLGYERETPVIESWGLVSGH